MSLWPWHSGGGRIQDLKARELAEAATTLLQKLGRNTQSLRLLYRALELDPFEPQALLMLIELFRGKQRGKRPVGDEIFSGIIVEYSMDRKSPITGEQRRPFDKAQLETMYYWGFVTPRGQEFDVDHLGYMTFINELMSKVGSLTNGFNMAITKIGISAGILDAARGKPTALYQEWLRSDAAALQPSKPK